MYKKIFTSLYSETIIAPVPDGNAETVQLLIPDEYIDGNKIYLERFWEDFKDMCTEADFEVFVRERYS